MRLLYVDLSSAVWAIAVTLIYYRFPYWMTSTTLYNRLKIQIAYFQELSAVNGLCDSGIHNKCNHFGFPFCWYNELPCLLRIDQLHARGLLVCSHYQGANAWKYILLSYWLSAANYCGWRCSQKANIFHCGRRFFVVRLKLRLMFNDDFICNIQYGKNTMK